MKTYASALNGENLTPSTSYLKQYSKYGSGTQWDPSLSGIVSAFQTIAANKIKLAYNNIELRKKQGLSHEDACNQTGIELTNAAESHTRVYIMQVNSYTATKEIAKLSPALRDVILQLCELYAVDACLNSLGDLLRVRS